MSAARAESLHADPFRVHTAVEQQVGGAFGEGGRAADEARPVGTDEFGDLGRGEPTRRPGRCVGTRECDQRAGSFELVGVRTSSRVRAETARRSRSVRPTTRACRSIATSGTTPEPPATPSAGPVAVPHEPAADRTAHLELVAHLDHVGEERRHLAVVEPLDKELDLRVSRRRGHRVRPLRGVAVVGGEPDDVVLAGQVVDAVLHVQPQKTGAGSGA